MLKLLLVTTALVGGLWADSLTTNQAGTSFAGGTWTHVTGATGQTPNGHTHFPGFDNMQWVPSIGSLCGIVSYRDFSTEPDRGWMCWNPTENRWQVYSNSSVLHNEHFPPGGHPIDTARVDPATSLTYGPLSYSGSSSQDQPLIGNFTYDFVGATGYNRQPDAASGQISGNFVMFLDPWAHKFYAWGLHGAATFDVLTAGVNATNVLTSGLTPTCNVACPPIGIARAGGNIRLIDSNFYVWGNDSAGTVYKYDFVGNAWTKLSPTVIASANNPSALPPAAPRTAEAFVYMQADDKFLMFGGTDSASPNDHCYVDTWLYDPAANTLTEQNPGTSPTGGSPCTTIDNRMAYVPEMDTVYAFVNGSDIWAWKNSPSAGFGTRAVGNTGATSTAGVFYPTLPTSLNHYTSQSTLGQSPSVAISGGTIYVGHDEAGLSTDATDGANTQIYVDSIVGAARASLPASATYSSVFNPPTLGFPYTGQVEAGDVELALVGSTLWACTHFNTSNIGTQNLCASYNGTSWTSTTVVPGVAGSCSGGFCFGHAIVPTDIGGTLTVAFVQENRAVSSPPSAFMYVDQWNGSSWTNLGGALNVVGSIVRSESPAIASDGGSPAHPYAAWAEFQSTQTATLLTQSATQVRLALWSGSAWATQCGGSANVNAANRAQWPSLTVLGGVPYVAFVEHSASSIPKLFVRKCSGGAWSTVGTGAINRDQNTGWAFRPTLRNDGTSLLVTWDEVANGVSGSSQNSLQLSGELDTVFVEKFDNTLGSPAWVHLGGALNMDPAVGSASHPVLAVLSGQPVVVWDELFPGSNRAIYGKAWNATTQNWAPIQPTNFYYSQNGGGTGTSCSDTLSLAQLNTATNWVAGNTLHLCGTFTAASANTTEITVQAGGAPGSPVTLLFETGAVLTSPAWSTTTGAIFINGKSNVTIDGGTNGTITATANGTGLANTIDSVGVTTVTNGATSPTVTGVTVKGLTITNLFVRTRHSETSGTAPGFNSTAINVISGGGNLITGNTAHDVKTCFSMDWSGVVSGDAVTNNTCYNRDAGVIVASLSASNNTAPIISGNSIGDAVNWDDTSSFNDFHHDGVHLFQGAAGVTSGALIYSNYFYGDVGTQSTALVFVEDPQAGAQVFNNVFLPSAGSVSNAMVTAKNGANNTRVANNTFQATSSFAAQWEGAAQNGTFENNIVSAPSGTVGGVFIQDAGSGTGFTSNNNVFFQISQFCWETNCSALTFAQWKAACACDGSSATGNPNLTIDGHLQAGTSASLVGVNLTNLGITALNSDKDGVARPSSTAWDAGAYQSPRGPTLSNNPTSLSFGNQQSGTVSAAQAVVVTNTGATSATISSCALTGTNANQFTVTDPGNCPAALAVNASFTLHVEFTPTTTGAQSANLTITDTPDAVSSSTTLAGTGTSTAPVLANAPTSIAFGNQPSGSSSAAQNVLVQNTGTATATISSCAITGTNANQFTLGGSCPATLVAGGSFTATITFSPTTTGAKSATLTITDTPDVLTSTTTLTGTGTATAPAFSLTASSACGSSNLGVQVNCAALTLTNTGNASGTVSTISVGGTNASNFGYTAGAPCDSLPATLTAAGTCTITPTMRPGIAGSLAGTITVTDTPDTLTASSTLSGTGVDPNAITLVHVTACASQPFAPSATCTIPATTSGNLVAIGIISAFGFAPTVASITGGSDVYAEAGAARSIDANTTSMADIWYCTTCAGSVTTLTITISASWTAAAVIWEFTKATQLDKTAILNSQAATTTPTGAAVTISSSAEAVISLANPQTSITGIHAGNGCTSDSLTFSDGWAHQITASTGTYSCTWDASGSATFNSSTVAFRVPAATLNGPGGVFSGGLLNGAILH